MKKTTLICSLICSLGSLFMLMSCDTSDYGQESATGMHTSDTADYTVQGKPVRTDLAFIAQQLTTSYSTHFNDNDTTLSQKIVLLDSASLYVPLFTSLKPTGFILPTVAEADLFLTHYQSSYINLNVSTQMKLYLGILVAANNVDYTTLADTINIDTILTSTEKMQLQFIVSYLHETDGDPIEDDSWTRKRIVAAIKGFEKSSANAVFNIALVKITQ